MSRHNSVENQLFKSEVHCFYRNGSWWALDVLRMLVFNLSPLEAEILTLPDEQIALLNTGNSEMNHRFSSLEVKQALSNLEKNQLLWHSPEQSLPVRRKISPEINALKLNIAQDCNLRCKYCEYCVAKQGSFGKTRTKMSPEVALTAVDFLLSESRNSDTIFFSFFGGEPLLNFPTIKSIVEYAQEGAESRGKKVKFFIETNGTLFNQEIISFIKENEVEVQVSLDGDKKTHDKMRVFPNGRGSYKVVTQWLPQLLVDYTDKVRLVAVLTPRTADFAASFRCLRRWGAVSAVVIHARGIDSDCEQLKYSYSQLAQLFLEEALKDDTSARGIFSRYMLTLCVGRRRSYHCEAATNMLGVSARGKFYPCVGLAEVEGCELGNVWEGVNWQKLNYWRERLGDVDHIPACRNCWARYLCAGGCVSEAIKINGNPWQPNSVECEIERHIIELSIWLYAELRRYNPKVFLQLLPEKFDRWLKVD